MVFTRRLSAIRGRFGRKGVGTGTKPGSEEQAAADGDGGERRVDGDVGMGEDKKRKHGRACARNTGGCETVGGAARMAIAGDARVTRVHAPGPPG